MAVMSKEWTDEKHSLYLKSMEASFVNDLYNSMDLLGWRSQKDSWSNSNSSFNMHATSSSAGQVQNPSLVCYLVGLQFEGLSRLPNSRLSLSVEAWVTWTNVVLIFLSMDIINITNVKTNRKNYCSTILLDHTRKVYTSNFFCCHLAFKVSTYLDLYIKFCCSFHMFPV